jgi:hypothetical protein
MANATHDKSGRPYARLSELQIGDTVELDSGFTCATDGKAKVGVDERGPYFICGHGHHALKGQADDGEHCVGVYVHDRSPVSTR